MKIHCSGNVLRKDNACANNHKATDTLVSSAHYINYKTAMDL